MDLEDADRHLGTAQNVFALFEIKGRKVFQIQTTIDSYEKITKSKNTLVRLIVDLQKEFFRKKDQDFKKS